MAISELLDEYRRQFETQQSLILPDRSAVNRANAAARRMLEIAREVAELAEPEKRQFALLLHDSNPSLQTWVAHHLLEVVNFPASEVEALAVIERRAASDGIDAPGERLWLRNRQRAQLKRS
jgi:hypothetical protein